MIRDPAGIAPCAGLDDSWRFAFGELTDPLSGSIQEIQLDDNLSPEIRWVPVRPLPDQEVWFETVWREYLRDQEHP